MWKWMLGGSLTGLGLMFGLATAEKFIANRDIQGLGLGTVGFLGFFFLSPAHWLITNMWPMQTLSPIYTIALVALQWAGVGAMAGLTRRRIRSRNLEKNATLLFCILLLVTAVSLMYASYTPSSGLHWELQDVIVIGALSIAMAAAGTMFGVAITMQIQKPQKTNK